MGTECLGDWLCVPTVGFGFTDFFLSIRIGITSGVSLTRRDLRISRPRSSELPSSEFSLILEPVSKGLPPKGFIRTDMKFEAFGLGFGELGSKLITLSIATQPFAGFLLGSLTVSTRNIFRSIIDCFFLDLTWSPCIFIAFFSNVSTCPIMLVSLEFSRFLTFATIRSSSKQSSFFGTPSS